MTIEERIDQDLKQALLNKDETAAGTLRLLKNALNNRRKEKQTDLREEEVISVLQKEAKQRTESIESFRAGGRDELAEREAAELALIERYLPAALSAAQLAKLVAEAINKTGAESVRDMGDVMAYVSQNAGGLVDSAAAAKIAKEHLAG